jgi:EAL domain-containing protein (putative c-di-GMP-specific phosphodiesterase class I)
MVALVAAFGVAAALLAVLASLRLRTTRGELRRMRRAHAAARRLEMYCPTTGLANRRRAADWLAAAAAGGRPPAAIAVALDAGRYGPIELGALARPVTERLVGIAGGHALAARIGPGRYLLALPGGDDAAGVIRLGEAVRDALIPLVGDEPALCIGAALAGGAQSADALIADAEQVLAPVTADRSDAIGVHGRDLERTLRHRAAETKALAAAIAGGRIEPFYQPLVELGSGKVLGFEALARWRDDDGRVRLPAEFVPLAEETGLIGEMYFALLRRAAADVRRWPPEWGFTLNLSQRQLADDRLVGRTVRTLLKAGVAPGRLELEISERVLGQCFDAARRTIAAFRRTGVRIALDNFGTGRMPLCDLAQLEFDRLKIDRALLDASAGHGPAFGVIVAAAHRLGVPVVVQGIETRAGAEQAQQQGAAIGQGFLFGRPDAETGYFRLEGSLGRRIDDAI